MPETFLGLLLLIAGLGPGYVYVLVAERREIRVERSPLLEAVGLFVVGAFSTGVSALIVLLVFVAGGWLDFGPFVRGGADYVAREPTPVLIAALITLVLSYALAFLLPMLLYQGKEASLRPSLSAWRQAIGEAKRYGPVFATVELTDGRIVDGYVGAYTADDVDVQARDLCLQRPIFARASARTNRDLLNVDYLVLSGRDIRYLSLVKAKG